MWSCVGGYLLKIKIQKSIDMLLHELPIFYTSMSRLTQLLFQFGSKEKQV